MTDTGHVLAIPVAPIQERSTFDFYRCQSCRSLLTRDDEVAANTTGDICECGGRRYVPTWPLITEQELPKVIAYMQRHDLQWPDPPVGAK